MENKILRNELKSIQDWLETDLEAANASDSGFATVDIDTIKARLDSLQKALKRAGSK
jgi:hypothetical protein